MASNKTTRTEASVEAYLEARGNARQQDDAHALIGMLQEVTGEPPVMWGPSIVGFGSYRYTYESGRSGEAPLTGFAIRGRELVVYLNCEGETPEPLLARLGKHRIGKSCLYFKSLDDLDMGILKRLVVDSVEDLRERYP